MSDSEFSMQQEDATSESLSDDSLPIEEDLDIDLNYPNDEITTNFVQIEDTESDIEGEVLETQHILFEFDSLNITNQKTLEILKMDQNPVIKIGNQLFTGTIQAPIGSLIITDWKNTVTANRVVKFTETVLTEKR